MVTDNPNTTSYSASPSYELGIAMSGGGARGIAHAGALMAIEEAGLKPDIIAGVSAGSVVAVLYAAGVSPTNILRMFADVKTRDFVDFTWGKGGLLNISKFTKYICRAIGRYKNIEDLPIPTYIGVSNFDSGKPEEFHSGEIAPRMTASCSIPVVMPPVKINGITYVDGGVLRNMPAWTIRDKCKRLIGINVSPMDRTAKYSNSLLDIAMRAYSLMAKSNHARDIEMCDLVVETSEISHHKVFDLKEVQKVLNSGYINTRKALRDAGWWNQ
mgnify:FL=1